MAHDGFAIENGKMKSREMLLDLEHSTNEFSPLQLAIKAENCELVSLLIQLGANVDLPIEPSKRQIALHRAAMQGNKEIVSMILQHTTAWDVTDTSGASVLHLAIEAKEESKVIDILKIFLDLGANVDMKTLKGETALFLAAKCGMRKVVEFLIKNNADVNARTFNGLIPLHMALEARNKDISKLLIEHGADVNFHCMTSQSTPIPIAAKNFNCDSIKFLLEAGANANDVQIGGKSLLHFLVEQKNDVIQTVLRAGAYCDILDDYGYSPFYYVFKLDNYEGMAYLLEAGADIDDIEQDIKNEMPLIYRSKHIWNYMVKFGYAGLPVAKVFKPRSIYTEEKRDCLGVEFNQNCQAEVKKMKALYIEAERSLYDFLHLSMKGRISCLKYQTLQNIVKLSNLETNFPLYGNVIIGKYVQAVEKKLLLEGAESALQRIVGFTLPNICLDNIFSRLSNHDLKVFIKSVK